MNRGLYLHIPFCVKKCHYCDFVITTKRGKEFRKKFFEALDWEIRDVAACYGKLKFDTIYWGGGTPSHLSREEAEQLMESLSIYFDLSKFSEFALEVNPGDVDLEKLESYQGIGVNRLSLGAQAFQDSILKDLGRIHSVHEIVDSIRGFQKAGFQNINLDLMLRLPNQSLRDWQDSLKRSVDLGITHISLYDLDLHSKTVFGMREKRGQLPLPPEETHAQMFEFASRFLSESGFRHYELTNFAKPGFESQHNLIYWHNEEYLGLGPGAFSYLNGSRYQFAESVNQYLDKCEHGKSKPEFEEILSPEKMECENLLTGLRLEEGISRSRISKIWPRIEKKVSLLHQQKLLDVKGDTLHLTLKGRMLFETILQELTSDLL